MVTLPSPRERSGPYRIALVCLGNICRSPMAAVVLQHKIDDAGLAAKVTVDSSGTGTWHLGESMDRRAATTLSGAGYDPSNHRAQQFDRGWFDRFDLLLAMDADNQRDMLAVAPAGDETRVVLFRTFDPDAAGDDLEVPDPWNGGQSDYDDVLTIVERTTDRLLGDLVVMAGQTT